MECVLGSRFTLQKTIQSLNRKTRRWCPLSEILVPGVSSHTVKEPWEEPKNPEDQGKKKTKTFSTQLCVTIPRADRLPDGSARQGFWGMLGNPRSGTRGENSRHAKASWTPWKRHLPKRSSSEKLSLYFLSVPADETILFIYCSTPTHIHGTYTMEGQYIITQTSHIMKYTIGKWMAWKYKSSFNN